MKRILFIATGFPPYLFSENIVNGKLVLALLNAGYKVDVLSRKDEGPTYGTQWQEPFLDLKSCTHEITYPTGSKFERIKDTLISSIKMGYLMTGIRWARRVYEEAEKLIQKNKYDLIITRSPNDISHLIGFKLKKKYNITWIANWNDPAATIWPQPYKHKFSFWREKYLKGFEAKMLNSSDYLSFPSETLRDHFKFSYPQIKQKENQLIIPHIALLDTFIEKRKDYQPGTVLRLCHSGNLSKERNPENLFKALKLNIEKGRNIKLDILGSVNPLIEGLIRKYELDSSVCFLGSLPFLDALKKMKEYDVLVLVEAEMDFGIYFPSKLTDYVQLGIPILAVSPANGYLNKMLYKFGGGIAVDNTNIKSIESALEKLYINIIEKKESGKYSSAKLMELYSSKSVVTIFDSILK